MPFLRALYLTPRFFVLLAGAGGLFVMGHFWARVALFGPLAAAALAVLLLLDLFLLFRTREGVRARREMPERLSNGDENPITLHLDNAYPFALTATVIDELPFQFQVRDARLTTSLGPGSGGTLGYSLRPTERGAYDFGALNVYAASPLGLARRRYRFEAGRVVPVYPSYVQMRRYELLAISNRLEEVGVKKMRRLGHTMEFDHIREYVVGDDYRTVNWKASARRGGVMVNQYQEERAQPVYCVLDMGRVMAMPFEGLTLLDYSINAALVLANIALFKQDRAGLITFSHEIGPMLPARRRGGQIVRLQKALYALDTDFLESDYAKLAAHVRRQVRQRSLLLLFTNFETRAAMRRQLPSLRALARRHVVVAIFFENTELRAVLDGHPGDLEGVYRKTIAEKFAYEKREVVNELSRNGIQSILTPPTDLTVNTINKYLALKARGTV